MSKANQKFVQADEAVSPVIGVILMVAITVVLAAVVFVLVSNLGEGADANKPRVSFSKDENGAADGGVLTVVSIENGPLNLADITIGGTAAGNCAFEGGASLTSGDSLSSAGTLQAGDQLECLDAGTITLSHAGTDTLLYSGSFE